MSDSNSHSEKNHHLIDYFREIVLEVGRLTEFFVESIHWWFRKPFRWRETIKQLEFVGNRSIFIICITGLFTGIVFAFQAWIGFSIVNAENMVGPTTALAITRELGPVLTGLIIAARAGGAMAAQIGTMQVTEQLDALKVMGVAPKQYLVAPRLIASIFGTPMLTAVFDFVAMIGAYLFCIKLLSLDEGIFWDKIGQITAPKDIIEGLLKSAFFGLFYSLICTYYGYNAEGGAKAVGEATNRGVVYSMVTIIVSDYFLARLFRILLRS